MDDWEDILATRKWPDGSDVTLSVLQAMKSGDLKSPRTVSHQTRAFVKKRYKTDVRDEQFITNPSGGVNIVDIYAEILFHSISPKNHIENYNFNNQQNIQDATVDAIDGRCLPDKRQFKDVEGKTAIANLTSIHVFMPLVKFRRAVRTVIILLKATTSSRHQANQDQITWTQIAEQNTSRRSYDFFGISFDPTVFKAKREKYLGNEAKAILCMHPALRTDDQIKQVLLALNHAVDSFSEFPIKLQRSLTSVGWYENFEAKRVIIRQGHKADNFYFILSGTAVVTLLETNEATGDTGVRTVALLRKGNSFGELALMHGARRSATVTCQTNVELLAVSREDFIDIFMHIEKDKEPEHIRFLTTIDLLRGWPISAIPHDNPNICLFTFFRRGVLLCKDSNSTEWIYVIKSGTCRVLKDLQDTKPNIPGLEFVPYSPTQSYIKLPPIPHSSSNINSPRSRSRSIQSSYSQKHYRSNDKHRAPVDEARDQGTLGHIDQLNIVFDKKHKVHFEEPQKEDLYKPDQKDAHASAGTVFVQIQKLVPKDVFGLEQTVFSMMGQTTGCSLVSDGAECILINKKFFLQHLTDNVAKNIRRTIQPIPSVDSLQQKLQDKTNWDAYKSITVSNCAVLKKQMHKHEVEAALYL